MPSLDEPIYLFGYSEKNGGKLLIDEKNITKISFDGESFDRIIVKNPTELTEADFVNTSDFNLNGKRFFKPNSILDQWHTEPMILEHALEIIAAHKPTPITIVNRDSDTFHAIMSADVKLTLITEMQPCSSCGGIIDRLKLINTAAGYQQITVKEGTLYQQITN